jgi:hypothetical protein
MSITAIARQAQGIRAGEVIAKLAEEAYFMRVDNRVNQTPPAKPRDNEATSRSANNDPNCTRANLPAEPNRRCSNAGGPSLQDRGNREVVPHRASAGGGGNDPDGGGSDPDGGGNDPDDSRCFIVLPNSGVLLAVTFGQPYVLLLLHLRTSFSRCDKNNSNLNFRLMSHFWRTIDYCQIKELRLQNRKYTWSNERRRPTLVQLDRIFCNQSWDLTFDGCSLHALSSTHSDHCPLLLANHVGPRRPSPFRFENFWTCLPAFQEIVAQAWTAPSSHTEPFHHLGHKLFTTTTALKKWSRSLLSDARQKFLMVQEVILRLDEAHDFWDLSDAEHILRAKLKKRILSWLIIEKARKK